MIQGRRAVFLYYASYGGGSGPLWAVEGIEAQLTSAQNPFHYIRGICRKVSSEKIWFESDGKLLEIPIPDIGRYDQFHLPREDRFAL